ncbi:MAG: hypothetical protein ABI670_21655 [Chloroflexota bacterium]
MSPRRQLKRSNLFVLRIWTQETSNREEVTRWEGEVRRAVDGEAHHFRDLHGLLDWLTDNLEENSTSWSGNIGIDPPTGHTGTERSTK